MRPHVPALVVVVLGCGSSVPPPASTAAPPAPVASAAPEAPPAPTAKQPEGPPLALANLTVTAKKQGEQRTLDLAWDVTRKRDVPPNTVLFVHSACKVGYGNKYEDSSVGGVDAIPVDAARPFKTSAFGLAPLPFDPAHCTFAFAYGPKGSKDETKLASFCWRKDSVSDGPCS